MNQINTEVAQPKVDIALNAVRFGPLKNLQGISSRRRTDTGKNATMHPEPEILSRHEFATVTATILQPFGH